MSREEFDLLFTYVRTHWRVIVFVLATATFVVSCSTTPQPPREQPTTKELIQPAQNQSKDRANPPNSIVGEQHSESFLTDVDHLYNGGEGDLFPNPEPRDEFVNYRRELEASGFKFVQVRPVEDIVADRTKYNGAHISLTVPIAAIGDVSRLGEYEGLSFTWNDSRFGTYLFVCPIVQLADDFSAPRSWPRSGYFHVIGKITGFTQAVNRLGVSVQIPTVVVYAIDDGWRFASASEATVSARLAKATEDEKKKDESREHEKDLEAAILVLSPLINKVDVSYYGEGDSKEVSVEFILNISSTAWHSLPDRQGFLLALAEKIDSICSQRKLKRPSSVRVWDTSSPLGELGAWDPHVGVYEVR